MPMHKSSTGMNPTDFASQSRTQDTPHAVVVDVKDPTESGRLKIRIIGEQDDVPDDLLPWVPVKSSGGAMKGAGLSPASSGYLVGMRVVAQNFGQQGWVVQGSMMNSQTSPGKEDRHPESTSTSFVTINDGQNAADRVYQGSMPLTKIPATSEAAMDVINSLTDISWPRTQDKKEEINMQAKTSAQYKERPQARIPKGQKPKPVSVPAWDEGTNAQKQVGATPQSQLIEQAVPLLESLKQTAKSGSNPPMPQSVGGMGNIMGALSSILAFLKKQRKKKDDKENQEDEKKREEELKKLQEEMNQPAPTTPTDTPMV